MEQIEREPEEEHVDRFVVLLRHAIAEPKSDDKPDQDRSLTAEGHARMKQIALGLPVAFPRAQAIYSSPFVRAVQTALWVSKAYRSRVKPLQTDALLPEAPAAALDDLLRSVPERRIVLVGHETNLAAILKSLTGVVGLQLKTGGCYGVRIKPDGMAAIEWLLSPRILRKLGEEE